jgi:hypothetical protein
MVLIRPLVVACVLVAGLAVHDVGRQLLRPHPIHAWEAALLADGWRSAQGLPVYEEAERGHATLMYGPLAPAALGAVFRSTGPSFLPARLAALASQAAVVALLVWLFRPPGVRLAAVLAVTMCLGFGRVLCDFVEPRPDGASILFGLLALLCFARALDRERWGWHVTGLAALLLAVALKQPAAMVVAVPPVALLLAGERHWSGVRLAMVVLPFAAVAALLAAWWAFAPLVFHYAVAVPARFAIDGAQAARMATWLLLGVPLVWLGLALRLRAPDPAARDATAAWLVAAVLVTLPASVAVAAKAGGTENSLEPGFLALIALFLHASVPLERTLAPTGSARTDARWDAFLAVLLLIAVLNGRLGQGGGAEATLGDPGFRRIVERVRSLDGPVASPQDPTVTLFARGTVGRSLVVEYDAAGWPSKIPEWFFDDLDDARWAVTVGARDDWRNWPLPPGTKESLLAERGFEPEPTPELDGSVYRLWKRARDAP